MMQRPSVNVWDRDPAGTAAASSRDVTRAMLVSIAALSVGPLLYVAGLPTIVLNFAFYAGHAIIGLGCLIAVVGVFALALSGWQTVRNAIWSWRAARPAGRGADRPK